MDRNEPSYPNAYFAKAKKEITVATSIKKDATAYNKSFPFLFTIAWIIISIMNTAAGTIDPGFVEYNNPPSRPIHNIKRLSFLLIYIYTQ